MIIGLTGYAQSGKDTVAKTLIDNYGFKRIAFADPIRELLYEMNPIIGFEVDGGGWDLKTVVDRDGWDFAKQDPEVRRLLQDLGVGARNVFYEDFWVDVALADVTNYKDGNHFVITDVRFMNELLQIKRMGGQIWRVDRPNVTAVNGHVSESALSEYGVDLLLYNHSTIENLEENIKSVMAGVLNAK